MGDVSDIDHKRALKRVERIRELIQLLKSKGYKVHDGEFSRWYLSDVGKAEQEVKTKLGDMTNSLEEQMKQKERMKEKEAVERKRKNEQIIRSLPKKGKK